MLVTKDLREILKYLYPVLDNDITNPLHPMEGVIQGKKNCGNVS